MPARSVYHFCGNNPFLLVDGNGMSYDDYRDISPYRWEDESGYETGKKTGISFKAGNTCGITMIVVVFMLLMRDMKAVVDVLTVKTIF